MGEEEFGAYDEFEAKEEEIMNINIDQATYDKIAELIHSDSSPVGIDAKKTHIYILHLLQQMSDRIDQLEAKLAEK